MECPKCGLEIDDNAIVCPHCKKVLKLVCPICKSVNDGNVCKKCGYVIGTKCHQCGKIALTEKRYCPKCNMSLDKSIILNEANTDDFVLMVLDFPNILEMKDRLGSVKLYNKFKINLDKIIFDFVKSKGIRRQLYDKKSYVIRFYKDYTLNSSLNSAIEGATELFTQITRLNCKLIKKHNINIKCNMFLLQKSVNDDPNNYESGFNVNLVQTNRKDMSTQVLNSLQIITDSNIFEHLQDKYKFSPLSSTVVNGEIKMFYELDLRDSIVVDETLFEDDEDDEIQVPNFVQNMLIEQDKIDGEAIKKAETPYDPDAVYELKTINFDEIKCEFIRTENVDVFYHVVNKLQTVPKGIIAIKTAQMYVPYSLKIINEIADLRIFNNIISVTCHDEMKYSPYAFFRDLVSAIFEYTISQKLFNKNDFSAFASVDPKNMIRDLITLSDREIQNAIDTRNEYFDIFLTLLQVIPNTLIFIENFDKIDSSSFDVLKYLFEEFDKVQKNGGRVILPTAMHLL